MGPAVSTDYNYSKRFESLGPTSNIIFPEVQEFKNADKRHLLKFESQNEMNVSLRVIRKDGFTIVTKNNYQFFIQTITLKLYPKEKIAKIKIFFKTDEVKNLHLYVDARLFKLPNDVATLEHIFKGFGVPVEPLSIQQIKDLTEKKYCLVDNLLWIKELIETNTKDLWASKSNLWFEAKYPIVMDGQTLEAYLKFIP